MNVRYIVELSEEERNELLALVKSASPTGRKIRRANTLLMAHQRAHTDEAIAKALSTCTSTVYRIKRDFVEGGLAHALGPAANASSTSSRRLAYRSGLHETARGPRTVDHAVVGGPIRRVD